MNFKKVIALLLTVGLISTLLTGCAGVPKKVVAPKKTVAPKAATVDKKKFKGKIEILLPGAEYVTFFKENIIPYFNKEYPNIQVVTTGDDKTLDTRLAAGDAPDIYASTFGYPPAKYAKLGKLVDYTQFPDYKNLAARIDPKYSGKVLDGNFTIPMNVTTQMLIYNKELFKEAGLNPNIPPRTFAEYLVDAKKISALPLRKDGSKVYGNIFWNDALTWGGWYWTMMSQVYYNFNNGKYRLLNKLGTDVEFDKPGANMASFFDFMTKAQEYAPATMAKNFFTRNVGMWIQFGYGWKANFKESPVSPMEIGTDVGVAPIPVQKLGDTSYTTLDGRNLLMFKSNSEKQKLAWELIKFIMRDNYNLEICKAQGQLPTLKTLEKDPYFLLPENKPFVDQLKNAIPNEDSPNFDQISNTVLQVYTDVVISKKISPAEGVKQAAEKSREILQAGK